jgi:hypothetical protein
MQNTQGAIIKYLNMREPPLAHYANGNVAHRELPHAIGSRGQMRTTLVPAAVGLFA